MKQQVNMTIKTSENKSNYPKYMIYEKSTFIVFFKSETVGTVVWVNSDAGWPLGYSDTCWDSRSFTDFEGTIKMSSVEETEVKPDIRMEWQFYPNENIADLHVDINMDKPTLAKNHELSMPISSIRGVIDVDFETHTIRVEKGKVFTWEEIQPEVERIVRGWAE